MRWSRRKRINKQKAEKHRIRRKRVLIAAAVVAAFAAADVAYIKLMDGRFYHHTVLNGFNVSGKTADEAAAILEGPYNSYDLRLDEQGTEVLHTSFSEIGYQVDAQAIRADIQKLIDSQSWFAYAGLIAGSDYSMTVPFAVDEAVFDQAVCSERFTVPRVTTTDAMLVEENGSYVIQPEVYGTDFENADLQKLVKETIDKDLAAGISGTTVSMDVPESIYRQPKIKQDDPDLERELGIYQQYCNAKITYEFGSKTEVLDWNTIRDWILMDQDGAPLDEEAVYNYVYDLAEKYDTYSIPRTFESTYRGTMTIEYNSYGYQIDIDGEAYQLMDDIYANTAVSREPVYAHRGYSRDGMDDLNGTYVEVDLSNQYLWFYKNGNLVVESPIISGLPTPERETHEGVFTIPYKASPYNLKGGGGGAGETWDVEVQYWMPFDDGQGLHDASWQGYFGGDTYKIAGSHGCINLPVDVAAAIYYEMEENVCILIYK